jgi:spore photoproduct lyase
MKISHLFVDMSVRESPLVEQFAVQLGLPAIMVEDHNCLFENIKKEDDPWLAGKKMILLTRNHGPFLRQCPGTRDYICCNYRILNIGTYCTMDCAYCILQSYFHPPLLHYFVNHDDLWIELERVLSGSEGFRVGTGEFTDSLIWEPWSDLTPRLVERFARQERSVLELKTKTTAVEKLKNLKHGRKTILSWSLNTPRVIANQERGTASLGARLRAAAQCQSWGYPLAFHFDPMVIYPGCEEDYSQVLQELFNHIDPKNIVWISMGTFRFMPALKPIIQRRFSQSDIVYGEFIPGLDGKMRYFKPLRTQLYRRMVEMIRRRAEEAMVYLCMEDDQVWLQSFGFTPESKGGLPAMLDQSARMHCGLLPKDD